MVSETGYIAMILKYGKENFIVDKGHNFMCFCNHTVNKFRKVAKNLLTKIKKVSLLKKFSLDGKSKQYLSLNLEFACWIKCPGTVLFRTVSFDQPEDAA